MSDELVESVGGESLEVTVPATLDGMRIDRALSMLTGLSRSEAQAMLDEGRVHVDSKVITKASVHIAEGQAWVA